MLLEFLSIQTLVLINFKKKRKHIFFFHFFHMHSGNSKRLIYCFSVYTALLRITGMYALKLLDGLLVESIKLNLPSVVCKALCQYILALQTVISQFVSTN